MERYFETIRQEIAQYIINASEEIKFSRDYMGLELFYIRSNNQYSKPSVCNNSHFTLI